MQILRSLLISSADLEYYLILISLISSNLLSRLYALIWLRVLLALSPLSLMFFYQLSHCLLLQPAHQPYQLSVLL